MLIAAAHPGAGSPDVRRADDTVVQAYLPFLSDGPDLLGFLEGLVYGAGLPERGSTRDDFGLHVLSLLYPLWPS
jgi:hypothetical protein